MAITIKLVKHQQVIEKLKLLDELLQRRLIREALRPAANLMLPVAKAETMRFRYFWPLPKGRRKGDLKRGLRVRSIKRTRKAIGVTVTSTLKEGARINDLYYGAFVNWGHKIGKRPGKGKPDHRRKVAPVPYLTAAFKRTHRRASKLATDILKAGIEREWKRGWSG